MAVATRITQLLRGSPGHLRGTRTKSKLAPGNSSRSASMTATETLPTRSVGVLVRAVATMSVLALMPVPAPISGTSLRNCSPPPMPMSSTRLRGTTLSVASCANSGRVIRHGRVLALGTLEGS